MIRSSTYYKFKISFIITLLRALSHEYSLPSLSTGENGIPPGVFLVPGLLLT